MYVSNKKVMCLWSVINCTVETACATSSIVLQVINIDRSLFAVCHEMTLPFPTLSLFATNLY